MNDAITALVRRHDPDRFLTALFAPAARRDALLILYALNHELARAPEVASEPTLALIRLQWWREVIEGAPRRHEVASPLSQAIIHGALDPALLRPIIEAREAEAYGDFETTAQWRDWLLAGAGGLAVAAASALGAPQPEVFRPFGAAYGVAGLLRANSNLAAQGRCLLPRDMLGEHGMTPEAFIQAPASPPAHATLLSAVLAGRRMLAKGDPSSLPHGAISAALPGVLAHRDLARWPALAIPRGLGDRLAVTLAGLTGRMPSRRTVS